MFNIKWKADRIEVRNLRNVVTDRMDLRCLAVNNDLRKDLIRFHNWKIYVAAPIAKLR